MNGAVVIGYGSIGRYHARLVERRHGRIAIVDVSDAARTAAIAGHPGATVASSLSELDDAGWDWSRCLCVIANWGPDHAGTLSELAARKVTRALCEKPLASSLYAGQGMIRLAARSGMTLGVHHHRRYSGMVAGIRQIAAELGVGEPEAVFIQGGASGLVTNGIHHVDWMSELFGEWPERVVSTARGDAINPRSPGLRFYEGTAAWIFASGREAVISFTNRSSVSPQIVIYFRNAVAEVFRNFEVEFRARDPVSVERFPAVTRTGEVATIAARGPVPGMVALEYATGRLLDEIEAAEMRTFTSEDALLAVGGCIGALTSGMLGRSVALPIDPESEDGRREWPIS